MPNYKSYLVNKLGNPASDIITHIPPAAGKEATGWPTQKPLALYERFIAAASNPGDLVLDPFCGCATTMVAAERLGRQWAGIDGRIVPPTPPAVTTIEPSYGLFEHQRSAVRRLAPLLSQDERRAVLHLPTGVGKTRTAMHVVAESLRSNEPSVVVWLASGKELLEQAVLSFREAWDHLGGRQL